ncbi:MAG: tetratricopeptide repeat protein, partial [Cytophagales bacterium]|nr:tetratricopeptide repeat protein [Cytophagales bacterium]
TDEPIYLGSKDMYSSQEWYHGLLESLEDNPDDPSNHLRLSQYFELKKNYSKALEYSLSGMALDERNCDLLVQTASIYQKMDQFKEGYELAAKAQQLCCKSVNLSLMLAEFLIHEGKYAEAQFYLNELFKNVPNQSENYYLKGLIALGEGDTSKAILNLTKYSDAHGDKQIAYELLASILLKRGKLDQAVVFATKGLSLAPSNPLYLTVSKMFTKLNQPDSAWVYLNYSLKDSTFVEGLGYAGEAYFKSKKYLESIRCFTKELQLSPLPTHHLWLAEAYSKLGDFDSAKMYYQQLLELDSSNVLAKKELDRMSRKTFKQDLSERRNRYLPDSTLLGAPSSLDSIQEP